MGHRYYMYAVIPIRVNPKMLKKLYGSDIIMYTCGRCEYVYIVLDNGDNPWLRCPKCLIPLRFGKVGKHPRRKKHENME